MHLYCSSAVGSFFCFFFLPWNFSFLLPYVHIPHFLHMHHNNLSLSDMKTGETMSAAKARKETVRNSGAIYQDHFKAL